MKNWCRLIGFCMGVVFTVACSDDSLLPDGGEVGKVGGTVSFQATLPDETGEVIKTSENGSTIEPVTRGIPVTGTAYPAGASFGVLGYRLYEGNWQTSLTPDFMYNRQVTFDGNQYTYQGTEYWPYEPVRFFAYHPYMTPDNGITISPSNYAGNPYVNFAVKDKVTDQVDLLLSAPKSSIAPSVAVFPFQHGLTRISFWIKKAFGLGEVKVLSVTLKNIISAGRVSLVPSTESNFVWVPSTRFEDVKEYVLAIPSIEGQERGLLALDQQVITDAEYQNICSPNGTLFLVPQQITAGRSLLIVQYAVDGDQRTEEILLPATTPGSANEWKSGKYIRYQLTINHNTDTEEVTLSVADASANCIMLDPTPKTVLNAAFMEYSIPVLHANTFYDTPAFATWNGGLSGISGVDAWGVNVIWMDKANLLSIVKREGSGTGDDPDGRFIVRIPVGNEGNALVGIYKDLNRNGVQDANEPWLWSWHLWVTDYNPNRLLSPGSVSLLSEEGAWEVSNGKVHRYRDAFSITDATYNNGNYGTLDAWTPLTGLYAGKVIMDRNLGSVSDAFPPLENNIPFSSADVYQRKTPLHVLYYEYGRKDPFLSDAYRYQENGTALNTIDFYNQQVSLLFSVQNPEKYIHGRQSWATDKPQNCYWYDPRYPATPDRSATTGKKSLFDPCPAGWRLPVNGTWSDFSFFTFRWSSSRLGRVYQPVDSTLEVFYPAEGFRAASTGEVKQTGYHGIYWTCSPIPANDKDYCFRFSSPEDNLLEGNVLFNIIHPSASVFQTDSFAVRCIQE